MCMTFFYFTICFPSIFADMPGGGAEGAAGAEEEEAAAAGSAATTSAGGSAGVSVASAAGAVGGDSRFRFFWAATAASQSRFQRARSVW